MGLLYLKLHAHGLISQVEIISPTLQMRRLRLKELDLHAYVHTNNKSFIWGLGMVIHTCTLRVHACTHPRILRV